MLARLGDASSRAANGSAVQPILMVHQLYIITLEMNFTLDQKNADVSLV